MSIYKIKIKAGKLAVFDPNPLIAQANDSAYWYNADNEAHWPAPSKANPTGWLDFQVAPGSESSQIAFDPPAPYTLNYVCALHDGEEGQIQIVPLKSKTKKGPYGGKTKKGAYGGKTKKGAYGGKTKKGAYGGKTTKGAW